MPVDVIVGAQFYDNGEQTEGRAFLYLGSASGLQTFATWVTRNRDRIPTT